jgi:hypothetical protein
LFAVVAHKGNFGMSQEHNGPASELAGYTTVGDWLDRYAGPFFPTRSSVDWFIKRNRRELVERGALIPREGRSGSLVSIERMPQALIEILKRRALDGGFLWAPLSTTRGVDSKNQTRLPETSLALTRRFVSP